MHITNKLQLYSNVCLYLNKVRYVLWIAFLDYPCQPPSSITLNNGEHNVHVFQQCKQIMFLLHLPN